MRRQKFLKFNIEPFLKQQNQNFKKTPAELKSDAIFEIQDQTKRMINATGEISLTNIALIPNLALYYEEEEDSNWAKIGFYS